MLVTDGASAMRSTNIYAGLDGKSDGISLLARMQKDTSLRPTLPGLHCMCHQPNLSMKFVINKYPWCQTWIHHVRVLFNWFSRSPGKKAALRKVHNDMKLVRNTVTWTLTYPKYYAPTRWLGIRRALVSLLNARELLSEYVETLRTQGYRPDRRRYTDDRNQDHDDDADGGRANDNPVDDLEDTRLEEPEVDDNRVNRDALYTWGDDPWDLIVTENIFEGQQKTLHQLQEVDV